MNSGHDLGGMQGFGPVQPEPVEPVFHADWERRVLALVLAMGVCGKWTLDQSRYARESLPPPFYLNASYYQIWLQGLERLLVETGLVSVDELQTGKMLSPPGQVKTVLSPEAVEPTLKNGGPCRRALEKKPLFVVGENVRVRNFNPSHHTRAPRYLRACPGIIQAVNGGYVFPDTNAHGEGENPNWLYTVAFKARSLWGKQARADDHVMADLWEPYLEQP